MTNGSKIPEPQFGRHFASETDAAEDAARQLATGADHSAEAYPEVVAPDADSELHESLAELAQLLHIVGQDDRYRSPGVMLVDPSRLVRHGTAWLAPWLEELRRARRGA